MKLNEWLKETNGALLEQFKWGGKGEAEFNQFMREVRSFHAEHGKEVITTAHGELELYKGRIYLTKQSPTLDIQGTNVYLVTNDKKESMVVGYIIRVKDEWTFSHNKMYALDEIVAEMLHMTGYNKEFIEDVLSEDVSS